MTGLLLFSLSILLLILALQPAQRRARMLPPALRYDRFHDWDDERALHDLPTLGRSAARR